MNTLHDDMISNLKSKCAFFLLVFFLSAYVDVFAFFFCIFYQICVDLLLANITLVLTSQIVDTTEYTPNRY